MGLKIGKIGRRAPFFSMIAAGSGRRMSLRGMAGRPFLLIFHGRDDEEKAREINREIRGKFPSPDDLAVASVVDLSFVPPFYWVAANMELDRAYREAAKTLPEDVDPKEYIKIFPDWTGSATRKYRAASDPSSVLTVVVDRDSNIAGFVAGDDPEGVVSLLESP